MPKNKKITSLDSLEKEIFRLKLTIKQKEQELGKNMDHFRENFPSYLTGSMSCRSEKKDRDKKSFFDALFGNEHVHSFVSGVADRAAGKTGEIIERLLDKLFRKH